MKPKYFKRYRMEVHLNRTVPPWQLPEGYHFLPWHDEFLPRHAAVLHLSFAHGQDSQIFPSLGTEAGALRLMLAIRHHGHFCPQATWLLTGPQGDLGTIQGLMAGSIGVIQNLAIVPGERGRGFGRMLLTRALRGYATASARTAILEVTANNLPAIGLYRKLGFRSTQVLYRPLASDANAVDSKLHHLAT